MKNEMNGARNMGSLGESLGKSEHFEIMFMENLSLNEPRFYFDINYSENHRLYIEDDQEIRTLFMQELNNSWENYKGQRAKQIKGHSSWIILETGGYCCIRFIIKDQKIMHWITYIRMMEARSQGFLKNFMTLLKKDYEKMI